MAASRRPPLGKREPIDSSGSHVFLQRILESLGLLLRHHTASRAGPLALGLQRPLLLHHLSLMFHLQEGCILGPDDVPRLRLALRIADDGKAHVVTDLMTVHLPRMNVHIVPVTLPSLGRVDEAITGAPFTKELFDPTTEPLGLSVVGKSLSAVRF